MTIWMRLRNLLKRRQTKEEWLRPEDKIKFEALQKRLANKRKQDIIGYGSAKHPDKP